MSVPMLPMKGADIIDTSDMDSAPNIPSSTGQATPRMSTNEGTDPFADLVHDVLPHISVPQAQEPREYTHAQSQEAVDIVTTPAITESRRVSFVDEGSVEAINPPNLSAREVVDKASTVETTEDTSKTAKSEEEVEDDPRRKRAEDLKKRFLISSDPPLEGSTQSHSILKAYDKEEGMEVAFHRVRLRQCAGVANCPYHDPDGVMAPSSPRSTPASPKNTTNSPLGSNTSKTTSLPTPQDFRCTCPGKDSLTQVCIASKDDPRLWPIGHHSNLMTIVNAWIEPASKSGRSAVSPRDQSTDHNDRSEPLDFIFITPLVSAGTLQGYISRIDDVRLRVIRKWAGQLLQALSFLHSINRAHGDVRLSNIHINGETGNVLLGAFNLDPGRTTESGTINRALLHMAPEFVTAVSPSDDTALRRIESQEASFASHGSRSKTATEASSPRSPISAPPTAQSSPAKRDEEEPESQVPRELVTLMKMFAGTHDSPPKSETAEADDTSKPEKKASAETSNATSPTEEADNAATASQKSTPRSPLSPISVHSDQQTNPDISESQSTSFPSGTSIHPSTLPAFRPTPASDIWALGLCLLEVSTKRSPYSTAGSLMEAQELKLSGHRPEELELILDVIEREKKAAAEKKAELATMLANISSESESETVDSSQKKPKNQRTPASLRTQINKHEERINDYRRFYQFLTEMLTPNPAERPTAETLLKHDFLKHLGTEEAREQQAKDEKEKREKENREKEEKEERERKKKEEKEKEERERQAKQAVSETIPGPHDASVEEPRNVTPQSHDPGMQEQQASVPQSYPAPGPMDAPNADAASPVAPANANAQHTPSYNDTPQDATRGAPVQQYDATQSMSKPMTGELAETVEKTNATRHLAESRNTSMLRLDAAAYSSPTSPNTPTLRFSALTPDKILTPSSSMPNLSAAGPPHTAMTTNHPAGHTGQSMVETSDLAQTKRPAPSPKPAQPSSQAAQDREESSNVAGAHAQTQAPSGTPQPQSQPQSQSGAQIMPTGRTPSTSNFAAQQASISSSDIATNADSTTSQATKQYPPAPLIGVALRQIRYSKGGVTFTITLYQATASTVEIQKNTNPNREESWSNGEFQYPPDVRYFLVQYTVDEKQVQYFDSKVVASYFAFEKYILERDISLLAGWLQMYVSPAIQNPGEIYVFPRRSLEQFNHPAKNSLLNSHQYPYMHRPPSMQLPFPYFPHVYPQYTPTHSIATPAPVTVPSDTSTDVTKTPVNTVQPAGPSRSPMHSQLLPFTGMGAYMQQVPGQQPPMHSQTSESSTTMNIAPSPQVSMVSMSSAGIPQKNGLYPVPQTHDPHALGYVQQAFATNPAAPMHHPVMSLMPGNSAQGYMSIYGLTPHTMPNFSIDKAGYENRIMMPQMQQQMPPHVPPPMWSMGTVDSQDKQYPMASGDFFQQ